MWLRACAAAREESGRGGGDDGDGRGGHRQFATGLPRRRPAVVGHDADANPKFDSKLKQAKCHEEVVRSLFLPSVSIMQLLKPHWIAQDGQPIFSLDIHPDGTRFATGGQGADSNAGRVTIWNMAPVLSQEDADRDEADVPKLLSQMDRHLGCVNCLRWSPSGHMLASGGDDKLVSD